jgi:hypothetical protein
MNRLLTIGFGLLLVVASSMPMSSYAANVQFDAEASSNFTVATNWSDNNPPTADGDIHFIENGLTADLTGSATVNGVIVGDISVGTLNVNGGTLNIDVTGGFPQGFSLGGHLSNHTGLGTVNLTNGGVINVNRVGGSADSGFVGERADGVLNIGAGTSLNSPAIIWRIGQFGGFFGGPPEFTGTGVINVQGNWTARYMYLAPNGGDSEVTVSGNGSIDIAQAGNGQLNSSIETFRGERSSIMRMVGSNATWISDDIIANSQNGEPRNQFIFIADAGGVSEMTSRDAILFNNASVTVDLSNYNLGYNQAIRLFDAAPGQLANGHVFGELNVIGGGPGDIFLVRAVPEPTVLALLSAGLSGLIFLRRSRPIAAR